MTRVFGNMERRWNADLENGTQMERGFREWNVDGTRIWEMEHRCDADLVNGTRMERGCENIHHFFDI